MLSKLNFLRELFEKTVAKQKYWVLWNAFVFKILRFEKFDHVLPFLRIDLKKEYILKSVFAGVENCWIFVGIVQTQNWNHYWLKARIKKLRYKFRASLNHVCAKIDKLMTLKYTQVLGCHIRKFFWSGNKALRA